MEGNRRRKRDEQVKGEMTMNCPNCNKEWIAEIIWGYRGFDKEIEEQIERREIILGGCLVTDHDPKWMCNNCHHEWGQREE